MCYLTIKEMANISEDVIIVTSRFESWCYILYYLNTNFNSFSWWSEIYILSSTSEWPGSNNINYCCCGSLVKQHSSRVHLGHSVWVMCCVAFCSLTKDMTGKEDVYRGPAIRALCRITDVSPSLVLLCYSLYSAFKCYYYIHNIFLFHRPPCYKLLKGTWSRRLLTRSPVSPVQPWSLHW